MKDLKQLSDWEEQIKSALEELNPVEYPYPSAVLQKELLTLSTQIQKLKKVIE